MSGSDGATAIAPMFCVGAWSKTLAISEQALRAQVSLLRGRGYVGLTVAEAERRRQDGTLPPRTAVVTFDDTGVKKPDPKPFLKALEYLDLKPNEAVMVGDWAERDMVGAKKVGLKTVFARYGDLQNQQNVEADFTIDDVKDLLDILPKMNGQVPLRRAADS